MSKLKSNRGACKRFKVTGKGRVKRRKGFLNHILTKKDRKRKRKLRQATMVEGADLNRVRRMLLLG